MDSETGLVYFRNRYYHPQQGRFTSRDPLGYVDGLGLHEAFGGRPGEVGDPMGLECDKYKDKIDALAANIQKRTRAFQSLQESLGRLKWGAKLFDLSQKMNAGKIGKFLPITTLKYFLDNDLATLFNQSYIQTYAQPLGKMEIRIEQGWSGDRVITVLGIEATITIQIQKLITIQALEVNPSTTARFRVEEGITILLPVVLKVFNGGNMTPPFEISVDFETGTITALGESLSFYDDLKKNANDLKKLINDDSSMSNDQKCKCKEKITELQKQMKFTPSQDFQNMSERINK